MNPRSNSAPRLGRMPDESVRMRTVQREDLARVFRLGLRVFTAHESPTLYRAWNQYYLRHLLTHHLPTCLVAEDADTDEIVGFALGSVIKKPRNRWRYGWLEWLAVAPEYQGQGIARRLLRLLTRLFLDQNVQIMLVDTDESNEKAVNFFRNSGFGGELRHVYFSCNLNDHLPGT